MTDKEVGELWQNHKHSNWSDPQRLNCPVRQLIAKLVEERAQNHFWATGKGKTVSDYDQQALRDFGIDPATWEKRE